MTSLGGSDGHCTDHYGSYDIEVRTKHITMKNKNIKIHFELIPSQMYISYYV